MKKTKTYPNERLQLDDYQAVAALVLDELIRQNRLLVLPSGRSGNTAGTSARILGGFNLTGSGTATGTLARGAGLFGYYDQGALKHGMLVGEENPPSYAISVAALPNSNYYIFVRMVYNATDAANRIFWSPSGSPAEFSQSVPTRDTPAWEYAIQDQAVAPPGHGEWVKVWGITVAAGVITAVQDLREFFFEKAEHSADRPITP